VYDYSTSTKTDTISLDVLVGSKVIHPELAARIGPELAHAMLKPWYKYPDCVIFLDRELRILEGKIHRPETAIGQLLDYAELIRQSPDFSDYRSWRVSLELVTPWDREDLRRICKRFGIIYTVYVPEWLHDYLELYQHYWSREYRLIKGLKSSREGGAAWP